MAMRFSLLAIEYGYIVIGVRCGDDVGQIILNDTCDGLEPFADFTLALLEGRDPEAVICSYTPTRIEVRTAGSWNNVQVTLDIRGVERDHSFSASLDRKHLVGEFISLCRAIAKHPAFDLMWTCFSSLPDEPFGTVCDAAEEEWAQLVAAGKVVDDFEAGRAFVVRRLVDALSVPDGCISAAQVQRAILETVCPPV